MSPKQLGSILVELRGSRMTQEQLAKRAKVSRGYLASIEAGHKKNPSLAVLKRLAKALGVPVTELLG
jgi:transcriptional regulator with XRE-family HTH domain